MKSLFDNPLVIKVIMWVVIIIMIYLLVARPIMRRLGIIKTAEDKKRDKQAAEFGTTTDSPFSPRYWKTVKEAKILTKASAEKLADEINDAIGFFSDDENKVYGVLRSLNWKTQLSYLADIFFQRHKMDLYQLLNRNLGDSEMDIINGIGAELQ